MHTVTVSEKLSPLLHKNSIERLRAAMSSSKQPDPDLGVEGKREAKGGKGGKLRQREAKGGTVFLILTR